MTYISLFILFIFSGVTFFHSALLRGVQVAGNYEFTKVSFFIVIISFFSLFLIWKKKLSFSPFFLLFLCSISLSTLFSTSPFLSFIGGVEKGHGFLFFFSLFLFINICLQLSLEERKYIEKGLFYLLVITCCIAIKERFFPSYEYGELTNRALGTLGSPNYLSGILIATFPFLFQQLKKKRSSFNMILFLLILGTLFLTLQWLAIFLFFGYTLFFFGKKQKNILKIFLFLLYFVGTFTLLFLFPEKLHSFLSRFSIWGTTLNIIFSSPKIFLFGIGPEMLGSIFSSYKVPSLYIYENFGFTADRAHNIFLDFWVQFGIVPFFLLLFGTYRLFQNYKKNPYYESLILIIIFQFFNFPSVITYLIVIFLITGVVSKEKSIHLHSILSRVLVSFVCLATIPCIFFLYSAEIYAYKGNYQRASQIFPLPIYFIQAGKQDGAFLFDYKDEYYYKLQILETSKKEENCTILLQNFPSAENSFFCGDIFKNIGDTENAEKYYKKGIEKLPDLWNKESSYWNNFVISNTITGNRFFTEKFSNIVKILDFLHIPQEK